MSTLTPAYVILKPGQTQQFDLQGFIPSVWTLYGIGTLDQNALYTAPSSGVGYATVSVHSPTWAYFNPTYFQKNADDSLTKITATAGYYEHASSNARLTASGDAVEFYSPVGNPYWVGIRNESGTQSFLYYTNWQSIAEFHPSGNVTSGGGLGIGTGDLMKFKVVSGGHLEFSRNGVVIYTSQNVFTGPFQFIADAATPLGTVTRAPRFSGDGITGYNHAEATVFVQPELLLPSDGCELYCEPQLMTGANGSSLSALTDFSGHDRHLAATSPAPLLQTGVLNTKSVARFNNSQPLKNPTHFQIRCGWAVVKYDGAAFPNYAGLLSGTQFAAVLVGSVDNNHYWYYFLNPLFEFRAGDRIYPATAAPGPLQAFQIVFFRFWDGPVWLDGVQLGSDRNFTGRLWKGDVALLALYSRDFSEEEIRAGTKKVAANFGLTLPDVYPYQADVADCTETPVQSINVYDPPEGGSRIVEVLDDPKRRLELKFSVADGAEVRAMKVFHRVHYPDVSCIYRDYRFTPPEDVEGYIDSPYELDGSGNDFQYSFRFREK